MTQSNRFQVLLIEQDEGPQRWLAQCLQYDIVVSAGTLDDVLYAFERAVIGHIAVAEQLGTEPFSTMPPAPQRFWNLWRQARRFTVELDPAFRVERGGSIALEMPDMRLVGSRHQASVPSPAEQPA